MVGVRAAMERLYDGECSIFEQVCEVDEVTKVSSFNEVLLAGGMSCHLSFNQGISAGLSLGEHNASKLQKVKLFLSPEVKVPAGSRVLVHQCGMDYEFWCSSQSEVYASHQEICLVNVDEFA